MLGPVFKVGLGYNLLTHLVKEQLGLGNFVFLRSISRDILDHILGYVYFSREIAVELEPLTVLCHMTT